MLYLCNRNLGGIFPSCMLYRGSSALSIRRACDVLRHFSSNGYRMDLIRNIGISAHIDSGKTTLTERILYYCGRIDTIHEVRGSDGVGAKMDSMDLERERGITIQSAATNCSWRVDDVVHAINIIDTPGHVDFTIEVERALRVLDGAILLCCAVAGVQSQTLTVTHQMNRYKIPRIIFLNKLDRDGADPFAALDAVKKRLGLPTALLQIPIGVAHKHVGVVDLIEQKAIYFQGRFGEEMDVVEIPDDMKSAADKHRQKLLEQLADADDDFALSFLEGHFSTSDLHEAIRRCTLGHRLYPVLMGSAKSNKGVQLLLNAVIKYLPNPSEIKSIAYDSAGNEIELDATRDPLVAYAFKIQDTHLGQLTYLRIYQGALRRGGNMLMVEDGKKHSIKRLYKMHSDEVEAVDVAYAGEIVAISGLKCNSGVTFTDGRLTCTLAPMYVPEPVVSLALKKVSHSDLTKLSKALNRFQREDPTFRITVDPESKETIMSGMGELHLGIYLERMRREYNLTVEAGQPVVNYRESVTTRIDFEYTHKRQSGGAGQYGKVIGYIEPIGEDPNDHLYVEFVNKLVGNDIPPNYIPSIEKGFKECAQKGLLCGRPLINTRFVLLDGASHEVDSSDIAFRLAAMGAFSERYMEAQPIILEPIMEVEVLSPQEFQNSVLSTITRRKGLVTDSHPYGNSLVLQANVALANMFGYISDLRSATRGQGEFTMQFKHYQPMNTTQQADITKAYMASLNKK